jgi:hypothetical protein
MDAFVAVHLGDLSSFKEPKEIKADLIKILPGPLWELTVVTFEEGNKRTHARVDGRDDTAYVEMVLSAVRTLPYFGEAKEQASKNQPEVKAPTK